MMNISVVLEEECLPQIGVCGISPPCLCGLQILDEYLRSGHNGMNSVKDY